ncbi:MAG TPA: flavodoxin [Methanobacterium sp.]|nr:flavodoxin [Methanobacterium sp.]
MKSAVLYYSRTEKTATAAKSLADKISGDLFEIKDLKSRKGIIGWIRSAMDARGLKTTQIDPSTIDTSNYDTLCIGTPVWAGKPTPAFNTMIKNFEIRGKDIIVFVTLGGAKYKNTLNLIKTNVEANGGNVVKTFTITNTGKKSDEEIKAEVNNLNIQI